MQHKKNFHLHFSPPNTVIVDTSSKSFSVRRLTLILFVVLVGAGILGWKYVPDHWRSYAYSAWHRVQVTLEPTPEHEDVLFSQSQKNEGQSQFFLPVRVEEQERYFNQTQDSIKNVQNNLHHATSDLATQNARLDEQGVRTVQLVEDLKKNKQDVLVIQQQLMTEITKIRSELALQDNTKRLDKAIHLLSNLEKETLGLKNQHDFLKNDVAVKIASIQNIESHFQDTYQKKEDQSGYFVFSFLYRQLLFSLDQKDYRTAYDQFKNLRNWLDMFPRLIASYPTIGALISNDLRQLDAVKALYAWKRLKKSIVSILGQSNALISEENVGYRSFFGGSIILSKKNENKLSLNDPNWRFRQLLNTLLSAVETENFSAYAATAEQIRYFLSAHTLNDSYQETMDTFLQPIHTVFTWSIKDISP